MEIRLVMLKYANKFFKFDFFYELYIKNIKMKLSNEQFNYHRFLRKAIISNKFKEIKNILYNLNYDDKIKIINYKHLNSNLTILNLSILCDTSYNKQMVVLFLENGADPNLKSNSKTVLMVESQHGTLKTNEILLKYGADPYLKDDEDKNSFDYVLKSKNQTIIKKFKKKKRSDFNKLKKIFYDISNLNDDCIKNVISYIY